MNPITPAYSVIALTIALGYTLAAHPASVFAQEEVTESTIESTDELPSNLESSTSTSVTDIKKVEDVAMNTSNDVHQAQSVYTVEDLLGDRVYNDFVVGPGRFDLEIAPGETRTVEMTVTNRMGIPKKFKLTTEDIIGSRDSETSIELLGDEVGPYSLKDFISVPTEEFWLDHAKRARIPITISLPADAEPGGFYGTILTQITSEDAEPGGEQIRTRSKMINRIGSLIFVSTPGEMERSLELTSFSTLQSQKFFSKGPVEFSAVHENTGTIHATPYGEIRIFNTLGNEVGYVELSPWYVLPDSIRNRAVVWDREFLVGRYVAKATINRGYGGIVDEVVFVFWVMPLQLTAAAFGGFFIFFILIRFLFSRFEFKRKGS